MSAVETHLERVAAFFRLPSRPYDPEIALAREGQGTWYRLTIATWLLMYSSLAATAIVTRDVVLTVLMGVLLTAALRVSYQLHFRRTSRLLVNWVTFGAAFLTGPFFLWRYWPLRDGMVAGDNVQGMGFLILCFMWITAFRAFALRTPRDLVETILPCGSVILLGLVVRPTPLMLGCMALAIMSALALLAGEHRIEHLQTFQPVTRLVQSQVTRRAGAFYSWPTLYALVLLVAVLVAWGAARSELSGAWAENLRLTLAQRVARWMMPRERAVLPEAAVSLARLDSWPNGEQTVFKVRTRQPGNYRLVVYHKYTGVWWQGGKRRNRRAPGGGRVWTIPMEGSGATREDATRVEQTFTPYKLLVGTLPTLFFPVQIESEQRWVRYDRDYIVHIMRYIPPGDTYKVISYTQPLVPAQRPGTDILPEDVAQDLQLPEDLPERVGEFAREITRGLTSPYDKAHAIEQHLVWNYKYTLSAPTGWPQDYVDHFLFTSKRGFCFHFATAMAIMCRSIGLPTRVVGGFLPGEEDPDDPDLFTVREKDAHAWPEVYFEGAGWTAFDPTPPEDTEESGLARAWKQIVEGSKTGGLAVYGAVRRHLALISLLLAVAGLALGAARQQALQRHLRGWRGQEPTTRIVRAYLRMRRLLVERGLPDDASLAPWELLARLPEPLEHVRQEARALTENYVRGRFGPQPPALAEAVAAENLVAEIRQQARRKPSVGPRSGPEASTASSRQAVEPPASSRRGRT